MFSCAERRGRTPSNKIRDRAQKVQQMLRACGIDRSAQNLSIQAAITAVEMCAGNLVWIHQGQGEAVWLPPGWIYAMRGFGGALSPKGSRESFGRTLGCCARSGMRRMERIHSSFSDGCRNHRE